MEHLFIINPAAGKGSSLAHLEEHIRSLGLPCAVRYTQQEGDCMRWSREAAESGRPVRIYACGGDGTLNEAVNGAAGYDNAAITNVPIGTGNDFLKIFGKDCKKAFSDLRALSQGPQAAMDVLDCNGRLGIDIACVGLDARVADGVHRYKSLPLVSGMLAYGLSAAEQVLRYGLTQKATVTAGDLHYEGELTILCVCSGRHYGGGFMPVGDNMPDDGVLETLMIPGVGLFTFLTCLGKYATGRYRELPDKIWFREADEVLVQSEEELVAVIDGETIRSREISIRRSDKKVHFFYPAGLSYAPPIARN